MPRPSTIPRVLIAAALLVLLPGCGQGGIEFKDPWIPLAPPNVTVLAGYLTIVNDTPEALVFTHAVSDVFDAVEFHRTEATGDVLRMVRQLQLEVQAHSRFDLVPGGHHLMLLNPVAPLSEGQNVAITLITRDGAETAIQFTTRRPEFRL